MVDEHFRSIWRFLRHLGLDDDDVDDVFQEMLVVVARKLSDIEAGKERSFMMSTGYRIALRLKEQRRRRHHVSDDILESVEHPEPGPAERLAQHDAERIMQSILNQMPEELCAVFILYELEELTTKEIASTLDIAPGTAASRLRRARSAFQQHVARLHARQRSHTGGVS